MTFSRFVDMFLKKAFSRFWTSVPKRSVVAVATCVDPTTERECAPPVCPFSNNPSLESMPRPKLYPVIGSAIATMTKYKATNGYQMVLDRVNALGKTYYDKILKYECVNVACPADAATVFRNEGKLPVRPEFEAWVYPRQQMGLPLGIILGEGEAWYNSRRAINHQMLTFDNLHKYVPALNEIAADYIEIMLTNQAQNPEGCIYDLKHEQFRWSVEGICRFMYDKRMGCLRLDAPAPQDVKAFANAVEIIFQTSQILAVMSPMAARFLAPISSWKHNRAWKTVFQIGRKHVEAKVTEIGKAEEEGRLEEMAADGGFMLSLMGEQRRYARGPDVKLNIDQVFCNAIEIMAGAIDTVATSQQWLMHLLARNPDKQDRLRQELASVKEGMITPQFLTSPQSSYLKACVKESLRLRPIVAGTARLLDRDVVLGGYQVPKGTNINILNYVMASDEDNFHNAHKYIPERWLTRGNGGKAKAHNFSSLPFGFGPRMCVGRRFAETEMYILTSRIVRNYKILDMNGHLVEPALNMLMKPKDPVKIRLEKLV